MRSYETIVIFDPKLTEGELNAEAKKVEGIISAAGASKVSTDSWGKKQLPYKVKNHSYGYFVRFTYEMTDPTKAAEITNILRITEKVIRFQTHLTNTTKRKIKDNPRRRVDTESQDFYSSDVEY